MQYIIAGITHWLYTHILKKLLFLMDPESAHNLLVRMGSLLGNLPPVRFLVSKAWGYAHPSLQRTIDGVVFPNQVGLSAGFDYGADLVRILPAVGFGFHTIGTITLDSYEGNPRPRLTRFPNSQSLLVNKGLKNIGAAGIIQKLTNVPMPIPVGISIASSNKLFSSEKEQINDITTSFKLFEKSPVKHAYYELNISCPNTFGGEPFTTPEKLKRLMKEMDALQLKKPLYVKMPIDQPDTETIALLEVLAKHKAEGVIFGNLTKDKDNPDVDSHDLARWQTLKGNLSGKPTWKRSNNCIRLTKKHFGKRFTIIGTGGIFSGEDAVAKMKAGADLVQLITGMIFEGPQLIGQMNRHLATQKK